MARQSSALAVFRFDLQTVLAHQAAAANEARPKLVDLDAFGNDPRWPEHDVLQRPGKDRALFVGLPGDDLGAADDLAVLVDVLHELRNVIQDVEIAHVGPHPSPHLHVGAQPFGRRAKPRRFAVGGKHRHVELPQFFELGMLRFEAAQIGVGLAGCGETFDHRFRCDPLRPTVEFRRQHRRWIRNAPAAGVTRVKQRGRRILNFGIGQRVRVVRREHAVFKLGKFERRHVERISPGVGDFACEELGFRFQAGGRDPQSLAVSRRVKIGQRGLVVAFALVGCCRLRCKLAAHGA